MVKVLILRRWLVTRNSWFRRCVHFTPFYPSVLCFKATFRGYSERKEVQKRIWGHYCNRTRGTSRTEGRTLTGFANPCSKSFFSLSRSALLSRSVWYRIQHCLMFDIIIINLFLDHWVVVRWPVECVYGHKVPGEPWRDESGEVWQFQGSFCSRRQGPWNGFSRWTHQYRNTANRGRS